MGDVDDDDLGFWDFWGGGGEGGFRIWGKRDERGRGMSEGERGGLFFQKPLAISVRFGIWISREEWEGGG